LIFRQYIAILILLFSLPLAAISQESEEQLKEEAEALFEAENYTDAFNKYSQLLSLQLQSPEYNYRFGACQLFTSQDKEQSLKYLKFAVDSKDAPNLSHFYYGLGLHLNYRFEKAIKEYEKYQAGAGKKEKENQLVSHHIEQCRNGIKLVSNFTDISVVQREALPLSDFYRNYDLAEFGGKIMVKPDDFMTEEDKKRDAKLIMYFQQNADYIYYAGYSEKNETGKDLYVIQKLPTGEWSKNPTKLSSTINTKYDEDFPFIHPDGNVLYFASKGHNSMGGYDIFKSTRRGDGTWTKPINMEFAINTPWDDFLFISDKAEKTAWFASNRETNSGQVVVYKIGIDRVPLDLTLIEGTFVAEGSNRAKITIEDLVQNKVIGVFESERQFGDYLLDLKGSGKYKFIVEAVESNAIHTGLVEVPREKGLKQFRQEMTLEIVDGKEQLQIINHFDEPLDDPTLLTAEILKKQARLSVNSSEDDLRTTEILDEAEISDAVANKVIPEKAAEANAFALAESRKNQTGQDSTEDSNVDSDDSSDFEYFTSNDEANTASTESDEFTDGSESDGFVDFMGTADEQESSDSDSLDSEESDAVNKDSNLEANSQFEGLKANDTKQELEDEAANNSSATSNKAQSASDQLNDSFDSDEASINAGADDFFSDDNVVSTETASDTDFSGTENLSLNEEETQELNEEIRTISATESQPEILGGDYSSKLQQQIAEASNAEDPVIAESRKAEIYDQWVENIDYRVDSLSMAQEGESDTKKMLEFATQITALNEEKEEKNDLAMASYAAVASMSDEQALVSSDKLAEGNTDANIDPESDFASDSEGSDDFFADEIDISESEEDSFDSFIESDDTNDESEGSTEIESENENLIRQVNPDSIPPVTPEILNSDEVSPVVLEINSSYTKQLAGSRALPSKVEQKKEEARINKAWAADLAYELQVLSAQIEITESLEQRNKLNELSANVASLRMEKVNKASALQTDIIAAEKEETLIADKNKLQQVLNQYVDTYNSGAFVQLEQQVANESNPELRQAKTEVLNQNWMVALKNEQFKTETRIVNSVDPKQKAELQEKLVSISAEKLYVQSTLDSLKTSQVDGPAPPKATVVKGSEKFEGYVPVATGKPAEYDEKSQISFNKIDRLNVQLTETEATLAATKKKKERVLIEKEIETIQNDLEVAQLESEYFEKAEPKIIGVEPLILQLESGDPTPSQVQMNEAQKLENDAVLLTDAARITRESANAIKKKKKRIPAQAEARKAEQLALLKRKEADLASQLANEMSTIEAKAIATNFIIPAGLEVTLPVVNTKLNPTESSDVAATEQFQEYNIEKRKADSLRFMSARLISAENQLNLKAQNLMLATSLEPEVRLKTNAKAYVFYDRADSLSSAAARLNRQAALIENDANQILLQNPEEVYNSILAYYNSDTNQSRLAETSPDEIQDLTGDLDQDLNSEGQSNDVVDNGEDQFDLTPPTQANKTAAVRPDVLTNTIFEASPTARSFYDSSTPIPINPPMPSGLIYKVQIGAFRNAIKQDAFKGIKPITGESTGTGLTRYSAGEFTNFAEANFARDEIRGIGYRDAFVVAYRNGKRVGSGATSNTSVSSGGSNTGQGSNNTGSASSSSSLQANSIIKQGSLVVNNVANQPGTFYTVQVGVFSKPVKSSDIYNITPLNQENLSNGTYRYTTGIFKSEPTADQAKNEIRGLGIPDAFVTAYKSGSRVTVDQARQDLGSSISNSSPSNPVEFTIFLGQFTGEVPLAQATMILGLSSSGVDKIKNGDGSNSYYYGSFETKQEAQDEASKLASQGLSQARAQSK
jgi:hypothetical protein